MPFDLKTYARRGAEMRLSELQEEMDAILRAFPDLKAGRQARGRRPRAASAVAVKTPTGDAVTRRRHKPMTAAQRRAVGRRMKKYWAERRKGESNPK